MFVHSVYFWLRPDLSAEEQDRFIREVTALKGIRSVRHAWVGAPADTDRPVIDRSYSYALTVVLDDEAAHDEYQVDPIHDRFREQCASLWNRVVIYDSVDPS
jgi:hypothetical protein